MTAGVMLETGTHFDVSVYQHVVVKIQRGFATPDELRELVRLQQSLSDIVGVPWVVCHDGIVIEQRAPGGTMQRVNHLLSYEVRDHARAEEQRILAKIAERGFRLSDRSSQNIIVEPETGETHLIDFVNLYRHDEQTEAWRLP